MLATATACGSGSGSAGGSGSSDAPAQDAKSSLPNVSKVSSIAKTVPAKIRKSGTIEVVMSTSSPPGHFKTESGMKGLDADLAVLIAQVMGLKANVQGVPLDQIIPGLHAKRYDVVLSQFAPTPERAKVVDFVNYAASGTSLGVQAGNPQGLSVDSLCGRRVGVQKGSSQTVEIVPDMSKKCKKQGKKPVDMQTFRDSSQALLALRSSRVDGVLLDAPVLGYAAKKSHGKLKVIDTIDPSPVAIGTVKNNGLIKPLQQALKHLKRKGAYDKVFAKWGVQDTALDSGDFAINDIKAG
ncbi:MAG: ABC transporter substrate-binding protein [Streptosporangiales bacterium]